MALALVLPPLSLLQLCAGENAGCHLAAFIRWATRNSQVEEKRVAKKTKPLTKGAKCIMTWVYGIRPG